MFVQFLMWINKFGEDRYVEAVRSDNLEIFHEAGNDGFIFFSGQQESHKGIDGNQNFLIFGLSTIFLRTCSVIKRRRLHFR